ncbi:GNAT family N-acetyltransferase [Priestia megaterium]|uniref:GNAT family N-acetyltransferase n=1 Tax=Priestia megaterium TaxID=1404 RepID=A0A6M6E045_PRIMG|nr:GNAT family N-acetyltransferase [Priestia megaterium]QJX80372.1 GNAT family N-acetyltransferase [Priestia megaterium]
MIDIDLIRNEAERVSFKKTFQYEFLNNIERNYAIKVADELIGFIQINRFIEEKFIEDYDMERYIINDLGDENTIVVEKLFIVGKYRSKGYGSLSADWIKSNYSASKILLCSLYEVEDFWRSQGFSPVEYPHRDYPDDVYETDVYQYKI